MILDNLTKLVLDWWEEHKNECVQDDEGHDHNRFDEPPKFVEKALELKKSTETNHDTSDIKPGNKIHIKTEFVLKKIPYGLGVVCDLSKEEQSKRLIQELANSTYKTLKHKLKAFKE